METKNTQFQVLKLEKLHESPNNPRKRFDQQALDELSASIKSKGILTPILVRPNAKGFEIGAGHRRFRAAKAAALTEVPCIVREMNDQDFLELLVIENDQREDVHPLEEANGYFSLSRAPGYDTAKIAARIGRSEKYVYDRLKLLQLTKKAQDLFLANKFTAGHAILLARLTPTNQERALDPGSLAIFEDDATPYMFNDPDKEDPVKPRSVREFQAWIDEHVRFDRDKVDTMLFPETAQALGKAKEKAEKIVPITKDHYVQTSARNDERIIGPRSWQRADGKNKSKTCDHSITGVFVVGPHRGHALKVCIAKEKCKIHWGTWQKERIANAKHRGQPKTEMDVVRVNREKEEAQEKQRKAEQWKKRFDKALPQLLQALKKHLLNLPCDATGPFAKLISAWVDDNCLTPTKDSLPIGKSAEDFVRHLASMILVDRLDNRYQAPDADDLAVFKSFGFDVNKMVNELVPEEKSTEKKGKLK